MEAIARTIRQRGFRKWYERELLAGHGHLLLLVLATLAVIGALEAFSEHAGNRVLSAGAFVLAGAIGVWAMRRYLFHLMRAESVANQAVCPACEAYARWQVERDEAAGADRRVVLHVCCRDCGARWSIGC